LAERVDRLERGGVTAPAGGPTPSAERSSDAAPARPARSGRSFSELKRERETAAAPEDPPLPASEPDAPPPAPEASASASAPASAPAADVDIDDVIVAWPEVRDGLPPATKAAVRDAQPLALDAGVITFGVPRSQYDVAVPRFKKEADNIRAALSARLGRELKFKTVPHEFDADPVSTTTAPPLDEEPPDDDEIDLADLVDDNGEAPPVDSVTLIAQSLGATVVEEAPRD